MKIYEALADLQLAGNPVPVCHPPFRGSAECYVTYQLAGQAATVYAEGHEAETSVSYLVAVFSPKFKAGLFLEVKQRLEAAGYIVSVSDEVYDQSTDRNQVIMFAETVGAVYG